MEIELELFYFLLLLFLWLTSVREALSELSWGRVRRIESKNKELAKKVEEWLEKKKEYELSLRILKPVIIAFMALLVIPVIKYSGTYKTSIVEVFILVTVVASLTIAKLIISHFDIHILRLSIPVLKTLNYSLLFPAVILLKLVEKRIDVWENNEGSEDKTTAEDEIMSLVKKDDDESEDDTSLEEDEKRMIKGIFELDDTPVREIMTPRVDVNGLPDTTTIKEAKVEFVKTGHTRIPIYKDSIDKIKGIIFAKDFLDEEKIKSNNIEELLHKPIFIPETKAVDDLLDEVKRTNNHIAVVIDEYGGTAGIVTLEDIIEEIVGEIQDEYDTESQNEFKPSELPDGAYIVAARTIIDDVNELLDIDIPENEDVDTIGGFVCGELGRIPEAGEQLTICDNVQVTVLKADKRKILTLKLEVIEDSDE